MGDSVLNELRSVNDEIKRKIIPRLADEYNTFQYVVKNLDAWADEVVVGAELRNRMQLLVSRFKSLMDATEGLYDAINNLVCRQEQINNDILDY